MTEKKHPKKLTPEELRNKWHQDKVSAMQALAAESAANDAKTARLRALRLAKAG